MRALTSLIALVCLCSSAFGQIDIKAEYELHEPIHAELKAEIPEGAQVTGGWALSSGQYLKCDRPNPTVHIWAPAGEYELSYRGVWLQTRTITIEGQELQVLQGFGYLDESAKFKVGGGDDSKPDPPTPPVGAWGIIVEESSNRSPQLAALLQQIRDRSEPPKVWIIDQDQPGTLSPYLTKALSKFDRPPLPFLVVVSKAGEVLAVDRLGETLSEVLVQLGVN